MKKYHKGVSLFELIITINLILIATSIAAPNIDSFIAKSEANNTSKTIFRTWQFARTLATTEAQQLIICGSDDGITCIKEWSNYIMIFQDRNLDGIPTREEITYKQGIFSSLGSIQTRVAFGKKYVILHDRGDVQFTGSFLYCNRQKNIERKVIWNLAGRPYFSESILTSYKSNSAVRC
jgi:Tfp pilus assembly protein FimT